MIFGRIADRQCGYALWPGAAKRGNVRNGKDHRINVSLRARSMVLMVAAAMTPSVFVLVHHFYERWQHSAAVAANVVAHSMPERDAGDVPVNRWSFPKLRVPQSSPPLQSPAPPSPESQESSMRSAEAAAEAAASVAAADR